MRDQPAELREHPGRRHHRGVRDGGGSPLITTAPGRRIILPVLCLIAASLCQWFAGSSLIEPAKLGMGAPVPVSWEAVQPTGLLAPTTYDRDDSQRFRVWQSFSPTPVWLLRAGLWTVPLDRQELLLWWGRLMLEGG